MSSAFETDSPVSTRPFDDDGYLGHDPRLESRRFEEYTNFTDNDSVKDSVDYSSPFGDGYPSQPIPETPSPPSIYTTPGGFQSDQRGYSSFSQELNGNAFDEGFVESDGPILPPPSEMLPEDGFALREWRRENAALLEEKTKMEKELLLDIISEADTYKENLLEKRKENLVANLRINREKEKIFVANQVKFHAEADKNYWKSIADLVPNEVIAIEKRGKKKQENKPSVVVIQGPKPGKPTDLSRMRQILVKLKHNPPPNMKTSPPPPPTKDAKSGPAAPAKDAKTGSGTVVAPPAPKAVAVT